MTDVIVSAVIGGLGGFVVAEAFGLRQIGWILGGVFSLAVYVSLGG